MHKLPLVGPLFRSTTDNRRRTELVVLITPRAIYGTESLRQITDEFRDKMRSLKALSGEDA